MSNRAVSAPSFQKASTALSSIVVDDKHPGRAAHAVVAAHLPVRQKRKGSQKPWLRWNQHKLSLLHTHRICGARGDLHQTSCLRCVERCGLLPLIARLSKKRNMLQKLFEHTDITHCIAFFFRYTTVAMKLAPDMMQQEIKQKVAFGWIAPINEQKTADDSEEEWEKGAMLLCQNLKS